MFTMWPTKPTPGLRCQLDIAPAGQPAARLPKHHDARAGDRVRRRRRRCRRIWPGGRRRAAQRPLPADRRRRSPRLPRTPRGRQRRGPAILRRPAVVTVLGANPSTAQARVVVDELIRGGVRDVVLCPGSRNAPLAFALHDADAAGRRAAARAHRRAHRRATWRSAWRSPGQAPVCVAMTSGTAVANLGPAVVGGQLRAGAADRAVGQPALRAARHRRQPDDGAARLLRHAGARGDQPRPGRGGHREDGRPERAWRSAMCRVLVAATGARSANAGPVQFDIPLREPLVPDREPDLGAVPAGPAGRAAVDVHAAGHVRPAAGHRPDPRHRRHRRPRRRRAPEPGRAADGRRTDRAARREPAAPARAAAAAPAAGDHAGPADAAPAGVVAAGRPVGAGVRADHRPALAGRLRQLAGHRHPRGHVRRHRAPAGCAAAPT